MTRLLCHFFDKEKIEFDALYSRVKAFKNSDQFSNYNQIYIDFELMSEHSQSEAQISKNVLVISPLVLDNEDAKEREGEEILFQEESYSVFREKELSFKGLPVDSGEHCPMVLLVPHLRA